MNGKTHLAIGLASGTTLINNPKDTLIVVPFIVIGSLIPDLDVTHSKFKSLKYLIFSALTIGLSYYFSNSNFKIYGIILFLVTVILVKFSDHRSLSHSVLGMLLFYLSMILLGSKGTIPFIVGYASHLIADSFTVRGISLLYPIKKKLGVKLIHVNQTVENLIMVACVVFSIYKIYKGL